MVETVVSLGLLFVLYGVFCGAYQTVYDTSFNYEIWLEIKRKINKADTYDVDSVDSSNCNFYVVINEDGIKVPVRCTSDVYATLEGMFNLNKEDVKIRIKAKIDRKDLSLDSVQGYLIK